MQKYVINGGKPLFGEIEISGAKNAAVAIIPAALLVDGVCRIENVPQISDVTLILRILEELGADVRLLNKNTVQIDSRHITSCHVPDELSRKMRASYYLIGALLGRFGQAVVSMPGGCDLGTRPIDLHVKSFEKLGARVDVVSGYVHATAPKTGLHGATIYMDQASVGATMNTMMAAARSTGLTIIENAAKEPHIVDLANFLNSMGADIMGAGTDVIRIRGVGQLHGGAYSIIPDQMVEEIGDCVRISRSGPLKRVNVKTMPYPGFPTDMQPQISACLTIAEGTSVVTEGIWENRYRYVAEFRRMGAQIQVDGKIAVIEGVSKLSGAPLMACDLRAGAAMVIAGLAAEGTTDIGCIHYIERGYENLVEKLRGVGADICLVEDEDEEAQHKIEAV